MVVTYSSTEGPVVDLMRGVEMAISINASAVSKHEIQGNWSRGFFYDVHVIESVHRGIDEFGHDKFDNTRSEMGELVYQLKYNEDHSTVPRIVNLLVDFVDGIETVNAIIPVPSSKKRSVQPVDVIAAALGKRFGVRVLTGYLGKKGSTELKNITGWNQRVEALKAEIVISGSEDISGRTVLLLDDLYRSGATLNACCDILNKQAGIQDVSVLTLTRTRRGER